MCSGAAWRTSLPRHAIAQQRKPSASSKHCVQQAKSRAAPVACHVMVVVVGRLRERREGSELRSAPEGPQQVDEPPPVTRIRPRWDKVLQLSSENRRSLAQPRLSQG